MDPIDRRVLLGAAGIAGAAALSKIALAGPLNPPPGPVTPTGLTLDQLAAIASRNARPGGMAEPRIPVTAETCPPSSFAAFNITQPGSYYLTGNLTFATDYAIFVQANDVSLDLCGYTIRHQTAGSGDALQLNGDRIAVRNGVIAQTNRGVLAWISTRESHLIEDLRIGCNTLAIFLPRGSAARRCLVRVNSVVGIEAAGRGSLVSECHVSGATDSGVLLTHGCAAERCHVTECDRGISSLSARIAECCINTCRLGISGVSSSTISGCSILDCGAGIFGGSDVAVQDCLIMRSTGVNASGLGISLGDRCTVTGCRVHQNAGGGIAPPGRGSVDRCDVSSNTGRGIAVSTGSRVTRCTISNHTTGTTPAGVKLNGNNCIVEENHLTGNTTAVDATNVSNNLIARNTCLGNTNFIAVNFGGNWYPNIALSGTNTATNPLDNIVG